MLSRALCLAGRLVASSTSGQHAALAAAATSAVPLGQLAKQCRGFATNSIDIFNVHKDTPENNANVPFEFTAVSRPRTLVHWVPGARTSPVAGPLRNA